MYIIKFDTCSRTLKLMAQTLDRYNGPPTFLYVHDITYTSIVNQELMTLASLRVFFSYLYYKQVYQVDSHVFTSQTDTDTTTYDMPIGQ